MPAASALRPVTRLEWARGRGRGARAAVGMVRESVLTAGPCGRRVLGQLRRPPLRAPIPLYVTLVTPGLRGWCAVRAGGSRTRSPGWAQAGPRRRAAVTCSTEQSERGSPGTCIAPWDAAPSAPFSATAGLPGLLGAGVCDAPVLCPDGASRPSPAQAGPLCGSRKAGWGLGVLGSRCCTAPIPAGDMHEPLAQTPPRSPGQWPRSL